ncbi:hypothetical protein BJ912DRAFT_902593 [Pholiota molesta]|nr:hypothetical protein BJ912DRAFT_902593 [Pholiota molesta]
MLAFDLKTKKLLFMKDYWRPNVADIEKEGDIYRILHAHKVDYIAEFGTGNDVRDHVTRTQEFINKGWARRRRPQRGEAVVLTPLCQYRMTLLVIGEPLTNFKSSKQFVSAIADAMKAHDDAYFKAHILHRDISVGNIIICGTRGLLIDWDMCAKANPEKKVARRSKRTGTWQFMSIALLRKPTHYHDIEDDRESAFYVMLWTALRYTKHSDVGDFIGSTAKDLMRAFDEARPDGSNVKGGSSKYEFLSGRSHLHFDDRPQLNALIAELCPAFAVRYERPPAPGEHALQLKYDNKLDALRTENWFVDIMQKFLNADGWPIDDKAATLPSHGVPQISPFGTENDLREYVTRIQEFANTDWVCLRRSPGKYKGALTPLR